MVKKLKQNFSTKQMISIKNKKSYIRKRKLFPTFYTKNDRNICQRFKDTASTKVCFEEFSLYFSTDIMTQACPIDMKTSESKFFVQNRNVLKFEHHRTRFKIHLIRNVRFLVYFSNILPDDKAWVDQIVTKLSES